MERSASSTGRVKKEALDKIRLLVDNRVVGIHKIGKVYEDGEN